jgi:transcriptional regulator with XRE-family HTH domain
MSVSDSIKLPLGQIGSVVKRYRLVRGLMLRDLAQKSLISYSYLGKIENGITASVGEDLLERLARVLDISPDLLKQASDPNATIFLPDLPPEPPAPPVTPLPKKPKKEPAPVKIYSPKIAIGQIGRIVKEYRLALGYDQQSLALKAGISTSYLSVLESGRDGFIRIEKVDHLADALGISRSALRQASRRDVKVRLPEFVEPRAGRGSPFGYARMEQEAHPENKTTGQAPSSERGPLA